MRVPWEKPKYRVESVNGECTAYSGTEPEESRGFQDAHLATSLSSGGSPAMSEAVAERKLPEN